MTTNRIEQHGRDFEEGLRAWEAQDVGVQSVTVGKGQAPVNVAGIPGWYQGDSFHTTSADGHAVDGIDRAKAAEHGIRGTTAEGPATRARRLFGLDGRYETRSALYLDDEGNARPGGANYVFYRREGEPVQVSKSTVGDGYGLLQPDSLDILNEVPDLEIDRGGVMKGYSNIWLQARLRTIDTPTGPMQARLMVSNSYDQSEAWALTYAGEAISCRNVYLSVLRGTPHQVRIKHTRNAAARVEALKQALAAAGPYFEQLESVLLSWGRTNITDEHIGFLLAKLAEAKLLGRDEDGEFTGQAKRDIALLREAYHTAPGAQPGTLFGLAQAVTFMTSHPGSGEGRVGIRTRSSTDAAHTVFRGQGARWESVAMAAINDMAGAVA